MPCLGNSVPHCELGLCCAISRVAETTSRWCFHSPMSSRTSGQVLMVRRRVKVVMSHSSRRPCICIRDHSGCPSYLALHACREGSCPDLGAKVIGPAPGPLGTAGPGITRLRPARRQRERQRRPVRPAGAKDTSAAASSTRSRMAVHPAGRDGNAAPRPGRVGRAAAARRPAALTAPVNSWRASRRGGQCTPPTPA